MLRKMELLPRTPFYPLCLCRVYWEQLQLFNHQIVAGRPSAGLAKADPTRDA
jgi:hypothetical protein